MLSLKIILQYKNSYYIVFFKKILVYAKVSIAQLVYKCVNDQEVNI